MHFSDRFGTSERQNAELQIQFGPNKTQLKKNTKIHKIKPNQIKMHISIFNDKKCGTFDIEKH